jgi:hypothetical protein
VSQSESGGPFLWTTQARTRTLTCDVGEQQLQTWSAEHDGYLRLSNPTVHRRTVTLNSPRRSLTIVDTFDTAGEVPLRLSWHLGPDVLVELSGAQAALTWPQSRRGTLALPEVLGWTSHRADVDPVLGWYSPRFGRRVAATSLVGRGTGSSATMLVTVLELP